MSHLLATVLDFTLQQPEPPPGDQGGGNSLIPDAEPTQLPGQLGATVNTVVGWLKGGLIAVGFIMILIAAGMIMAGMKNRNSMSTDGISRVVWVIGGFGVAASAGGIAGAFIP